jgi:phosphocarrier protein HPr
MIAASRNAGPPADDHAIEPIPAATAPQPDAIEASGGAAEDLVLRRTVTIRNQRGLHARAAAKFVGMAERYGACLSVVRDGQSVAGRSIMGLMMLGAGPGAILTLEAEGWDAREALDALAGLVEAGFDEI